MSEELLPCPFCGGTDVDLSFAHGMHLGTSYAQAGCNNCNAEGPRVRYPLSLDAAIKRKVVAKWNTRAGNCPEIPDSWISVDDRLPNEGGRYWCYVRELNDLGFSHYQWNCSWNEREWGVDAGGTVTHWMRLPEPPK